MASDTSYRARHMQLSNVTCQTAPTTFAFLLDILTVCPQCSMSSYPNFPNIFPQDSHVDLKQCPTKTFCIQYIIQEFSSLSLVQQFLFNYSPYTVPKEIDFPRYNMQRGKRDTMQNISCSIMFSTTFQIISWKFGILFGQYMQVFRNVRNITCSAKFRQSFF